MSNQEFESRGRFWRAEDTVPDGLIAPSNAVGGQLIIDTEGRAELQLDGMLAGEGGMKGVVYATQRTDKPVAIRGFLTGSNEHILLPTAYNNGVNWTTGAPSTQRFVALACLVGKTSIKPSQAAPKFARTRFDLADYGDWLAARNSDVDFSKNRTRYSYKKPKSRKYESPHGVLKIDQHLEFESGSRGSSTNGFSATEAAGIVYQFQNARTLDQVLSETLLIEDFLVLLTGAERQPRWPIVRLWGSKCDYTLYHARWAPIKNNTSFYPWSRLQDVDANFGELFSAWVACREKYGPGFYFYMGTRRGMKFYLEHRFINLVWGLESFHRTKFGDATASASLTARLERIYASVAEGKDTRWLRGRLKHAAEPSLEQRLSALLGQLPLGVEKSRLQDFCRQCAQLRNDISHFGGVRDGAGQDGDWLRRLSDYADALSLLYHVLLLAEIGLPLALQERIIKQTHSHEFRWSFRAVGLSAAEGPA